MNRLYRPLKELRLCLRPVRLAALALLATVALPGALHAKLSVLDSPHNLSSLGGRGKSSGEPGTAVFAEEARVCVFCHVPHRATAGTPLWSRGLPSGNDYKPYNESSTLKASPKPDKPTGSSRMCLSCHDGTIAPLNRYQGSKIAVDRYMPTDYRPAFNANLSLDLRDDHPISFLYTEALAARGGLVSPADLPGHIMLEGRVSLECTACHDPHDNQYGNFLVINNGNPGRPGYLPGSPLCNSCHIPTDWPSSTHNNPSLPALNKGCMNCHMVHNAAGPVRLLGYAKMEQNCLGSCHNGDSTEGANMEPLFAVNMYRHPVEYHDPLPSLDHDEMETLPATNYHVQCVDCHNPHQVNGSNAPLTNAPQISGRLKGVRKDSAGNYASTEFDICFKCHSGGNAEKFYGQDGVLPDRMIPEPDQMKRFDSRNPSFHPVTANRRTAGASLLEALRPNLVRIYCTDCHNSDQSAKALGSGTGPNGPHGSKYRHILIARYEQPRFEDPREPFSNSLYSLCFRCHWSDYVMTSGSAFKNGLDNLHGFHVRDKQIACFVCHDPHGVSQERGATAANNSHLINFDKSYTVGSFVAAPQYVAGVNGGSCTVNCHTNAGNTRGYGDAAAQGRALLQRKPMNLRSPNQRPVLPSLPGLSLPR